VFSAFSIEHVYACFAYVTVGFKSSQELVLLYNIYSCTDYKQSFELEHDYTQTLSIYAWYAYDVCVKANQTN
jgi:hypothetical protein